MAAGLNQARLGCAAAMLVAMLSCMLAGGAAALVHTGAVPAPRIMANLGVVTVAAEKRVLLHGCETLTDYACLATARAEVRTAYMVALIFPRNLQPRGRRFFILRFPLRQ
jgi:hypothetical protein